MSEKKFDFKPLGDDIIFKPIRKSHKTFVMPDKVSYEENMGLVVAVGSGKRLKDGTILKPQVKVGDRILVGNHKSLKIEYEGELYGRVKDADVLAIFDEDEED